MGRMLRRGVLFTVLMAGLVAPAAADPILMFLIGIAREMIVSHGTTPEKERVPAIQQPNWERVYPGTSVEPDHLLRLINDSFLYLPEDRRREIFDSLHAALVDPKNAAVRGAMIEYFAEKALAIRAAQLKFASMSWQDKQRMAEAFKTELAGLSREDREQWGNLLRNGMLPVPSDVNQLLLGAFEAR